VLFPDNATQVGIIIEMVTLATPVVVRVYRSVSRSGGSMMKLIHLLA
jgi:hypothetical protein